MIPIYSGISSYRFGRNAGHFAKFRALNYNASEDAKEIWKLYAPEVEFKLDFELSPIHCAALYEYDANDRERPSLEDVLQFGNKLAKENTSDWSSIKRDMPKHSPLHSEVLDYFNAEQKKGKLPKMIFKELIEQPDIIQKWTPLFWAAFAGRTENVETLLDREANAFAITPVGRNIFHHAAESGNEELFELLFRRRLHDPQKFKTPVDINRRDKWGETPLHVACQNSPFSVEMLLNHGAWLDVRQNSAETPFHYVHYQTGDKRLSTLKTLLLRVEDGEPLINATNTAGEPPLFYLLGSSLCVQMLLDKGADATIVDLEGRTALHHVCMHNYHESLIILLKSGASNLVTAPDSERDTPLFTAFRSSAKDCAKILLQHQHHNPRMTDKDGWTMLHHAAGLNDEAVLGLVLSIPKLPKRVTTNGGQTALDIARSKRCSSRIKEILVNAGCV